MHACVYIYMYVFCYMYNNNIVHHSFRNLKIDVNFPKSVLTIWTSVAKQRGVECIIESGTASISYKSVLTPYTDGLIRRPNRTWNVVSFSGNVKDLIVFIEKSKDRTSKVNHIHLHNKLIC